MADIATGSTVTFKIVKTPTNEAARKTLVRLLSKDKAVITEDKRLRKARKDNLVLAPRSGRLWAINVVKQRPVTGKIGEQGTILASYDVVKDLKSVEKFIEVSAA